MKFIKPLSMHIDHHICNYHDNIAVPNTSSPGVPPLDSKSSMSTTGTSNHDAGFIGPEDIQGFSAMLFDMGKSRQYFDPNDLFAYNVVDGTLVNSINAIAKYWHKSLPLLLCPSRWWKLIECAQESAENLALIQRSSCKLHTA